MRAGAGGAVAADKPLGAENYAQKVEEKNYSNSLEKRIAFLSSEPIRDRSQFCRIPIGVH